MQPFKLISTKQAESKALQYFSVPNHPGLFSILLILLLALISFFFQSKYFSLFWMSSICHRTYMLHHFFSHLLMGHFCKHSVLLLCKLIALHCEQNARKIIGQICWQLTSCNNNNASCYAGKYNRKSSLLTAVLTYLCSY